MAMQRVDPERQPMFEHTTDGAGATGSVQSGYGTTETVEIPEADQAKRLGVWSTTFFIVTGVMLTLPLPQSFAQAGLIGGILIMITIAGCISYQAVALGRCWLILQERWPEKYGHNVMIRRPYPSIALEATGRRWIFYLTEIGIDITNFGVGVVDLLISAQSLHCTLLPDVGLNVREWLCIVTAVTWPFVLLGAPMESWAVGWAGGFGCLLASFLLIVALAMAAAGGGTLSKLPIVHSAISTTAAAVGIGSSSGTEMPISFINDSSHTDCFQDQMYQGSVGFESFWIGASTLIFAFAGLSLFPTFQHDMKEPRKWGHAALRAYGLICSFSIITALLGYLTYRGDTRSNILDNITEPYSAKVLAKVTSGIFVVVYLCNGVVAFIPVTADFEEMFRLKKKFTWKHFLIRTVVIWAGAGLAAAKPDFDKFLPLIGSTAIALNNFIFPAWFHLLLNGKNLALHEKVINVEILGLGIVGALAGTYASILGIIS